MRGVRAIVPCATGRETAATRRNIDRRPPRDYLMTKLGQDNPGTIMETVNLYEAKTNLSRLVERAAAGEEIVIAKAGRPLARLVPLARRTEPRPLGLLKGQVWIGPDFDDPLPEEIMRAFRGEEP